MVLYIKDPKTSIREHLETSNDLTKVVKTVKYLRINLIKEVKGPYSEISQGRD